MHNRNIQDQKDQDEKNWLHFFYSYVVKGQGHEVNICLWHQGL